MLLYVFITLLITIELVISGPLLSRNLLQRRDRRASKSFFDDVLKGDNFYKRDQVTYNKYGDRVSEGKRAVVDKNTKLWPYGIIPYDLSNMKHEDQKIIEDSMFRIMLDTGKEDGDQYNLCIAFVPKQPDDKTWIIFQYGEGCSAHVGYYAGFNNKVTLGNGCMSPNVIQHELMHVIGFDHEQSSPYRDDYVKVYPENINPDYLSQFQKFDKDDVVDLNIPYDVNSIMQYPEYSFTKSGATGPSMEVIDKTKPFPPYVYDRSLSPLDILGVQRLYKCPT